ncbi:LppU/SCO3897 family protein [Kitasatospora indigofera]|uniref:LppU/SCO3897 family protein n=1 Tax=Kitasatospora indigofera TaxID=67307 RepID=UPI0036B359CE
MSTPPVSGTPHQLPEFPPGISAEPPAKPSAGKKVKKILGIVVAVLVAFVAFGYFVQDDPSIAEAGNCVHNSGSDTKPKVAIVDCGAANADFKVLKVIRNTSDTKACESVEGVEAAYLEDSADAFVLCLAKNH